MKENVKLELALMFDQDDKEIQKIVATEASKSLQEAFEEMQKESRKREKLARLNTIETLTDDEIALVVKLHMQKIIKEYENQSKTNVDIIVR